MNYLANADAIRESLAGASTRLEEIADDMHTAKVHDHERYETLKADHARTQAEVEGLKATLSNMRAPSKALAIGSGPSIHDQPMGMVEAVTKARSHDMQEQAEGKAALDAYRYSEPQGKATLGNTAASGGWIVAGDPVDDIIKAPAFDNIYLRLMTVVRGINSSGIDLPYRSYGSRPARATIASWGSEKENLDLEYSGYTATMYTLARIHDISNQFLRKSQGAAEQDVMGELNSAMSRGFAYYLRDGSGSGEPMGFQTALVTSPPFTPTVTTTHTAAAATVAGSVAAAIAKSAAAIMGRGHKPTAAVMSPDGYSEMLVNGADAAGFFIAGVSSNGTGSAFAPGTLVSPFGIPIYVDLDATTDDLYVADWSKFKIYVGDVRLDSSSEAGTRFDYNVTGVRLESELGFDARPAVYGAGCAQVTLDILS